MMIANDLQVIDDSWLYIKLSILYDKLVINMIICLDHESGDFWLICKTFINGNDS